MVTHWESSRRPLYVRTIWKDGQHHVILDQTKETQHDLITTSRRSKQSSSSQSSYRTTKSAGASVNLKVSSVRVLLSGIKGFKNTHEESRIRDKSTERPKTWTQQTVSRHVTCKDLNKEVTFNAIRGSKPPSLYKFNTLDSELSELIKPEKYQSNVLDNALSERVMLWLDLATHNNCQTIQDTKGRDCTVTAQACNIITKPFAIDCNDHAPENIKDSSILKNTSPRQDENKKESITVFSNEETEVPRENFYQVLTPSPTASINDYTYREVPTEVEEEETEADIKTVKRQLHIFMPNLPKKYSDCGSSILSSKISVN